MPVGKVLIKPGVDVEATPLLNESGWSQSQFIRFFQGKIQKLGGWAKITTQKLVGICRGLLAWNDLTGVGYIAAGTDQRLQVYNAGTIYDITPIRKTDNLATPFSTTSTSTTVTVHDAANGSSVGDWVDVLTYTAIDGIVIQGFYQVQSIIDNDHYTIAVANAATGTVANGGATSLFTTTNTSNVVQVTLNNHGFQVGDTYTVYVSTTVATVVIFGTYPVQTVIDANNFTISTAGVANASTTGSENSGNVRIQYLLATGLSTPIVGGGYGLGAYGIGPYGLGGFTGSQVPIRQWTLSSWGQQLIACPTGGTIYFWNPASGFFENWAAVLTNSPAANTGQFIAMPQQQIVAFGVTDPGTGNQDPMLVAWCDVANYTVWTAASTNQAGSFRLPRGSKIVCGIQGPQYGLLWTDLGMWMMQYVGYPLVYGFQEVSQGCGLIGMRAQCVLGADVYWLSLNQFYKYDGQSVQPLPCTVWDVMFQNLNFFNQDKICFGANSHFNEFFVFYPSLSGNGENDSYLKYNSLERVWDYGTIIRTAWYDQNDVLGSNPLGTDVSGLIQQHEGSQDADGVPMLCSATTGWFKIANGELYIFLERIIPDFVMSGNNSINITVSMINYPDDTPKQYGPFFWNTSTEYIVVRGRGRLARVQISSSDIGSFWRLGEMLYFASPSGRR